MRLTPNWLVLASVAGGVVFAVISCSEVVDPKIGLPPQPRFVEGPLPHGITYVLGAGATNASPDYGALPYVSTGVVVPPGAVGRVRASGDLTLSENPECQGVFWGDLRSPISPSGAIQNWGRADVNYPFGLTEGTQWGTSSISQYVVHLSNWDTIPQPLMAAREHIMGECWIPPTDPPVTTFDFYISGSTTLSIDVLGVNVTASASSVRPGESVNYSATPINFPPGQIFWKYDTLSVYGLVIDVPACDNQTVCTYAPPKTGRMQVCMIDEDDAAICDESPLVTVAPWINGAPPCRAKVVASYTRISLNYDSTDIYHKDPHMGQDYAEPDTAGVAVMSADSGTVLFADWAKSAGYAIAVRSANPDARELLLDSYYYHLKQGSLRVVPGQPVSAGQFLASSDNSGKWPDGTASSHGGHVHFEQHTRTPGKGAFPLSGKNDRATAVVPCTF